MGDIYDFSATTADGSDVNLADYRGKVLLIVNTASKCGFTPQYEGLEALRSDFSDRGFEILAFPCNQFGNQEPGTEEEIVEFCSLNFSTTFPLFAKIDVNGSDAHPLYEHLKEQAPGVLGTKSIKWNFTKFLVNSNGEVVKRYASKDKPASIAKDIEALLEA
ncbi:glutathione peroxidase [Luminiphilus syltensis NOR5-1B]|uniref:Glutathione peroxidase n=1 Tax=Luminiphilus syltensis NOR5-1B TaxID=565045 RepID=B8KSK9_9GAMM|nr:glutathione peroxidase [Luminiphilus syltensis]EED36756.1 glutathione peroxidase [Luminiphilus syltensis NOR5-1B]